MLCCLPLLTFIHLDLFTKCSNLPTPLLPSSALAAHPVWTPSPPYSHRHLPRLAHLWKKGTPLFSLSLSRSHKPLSHSLLFEPLLSSIGTTLRSSLFYCPPLPALACLAFCPLSLKETASQRPTNQPNQPSTRPFVPYLPSSVSVLCPTLLQPLISLSSGRQSSFVANLFGRVSQQQQPSQQTHHHGRLSDCGSGFPLVRLFKVDAGSDHQAAGASSSDAGAFRRGYQGSAEQDTKAQEEQISGKAFRHVAIAPSGPETIAPGSPWQTPDEDRKVLDR